MSLCSKNYFESFFRVNKSQKYVMTKSKYIPYKLFSNNAVDTIIAITVLYEHKRKTR